jgi:uncharacterized ferredoxin-like protein
MNKEFDEQSITALASMLLASARTAPKSRGLDTLHLKLVTRAEEMSRIAERMEELHRETGRQLFMRDSKNLRESEGCLLFGIENQALGLDCGACGMSCAELTDKLKEGKNTGHYDGPVCAFKAMDLGIAVGSAAKTAAAIGIDCRVMYSIGAAAKALKLIEGACVLALPFSLKGKNIYFDRQG